MDYNVLIDLDNKNEEYALESVAKQANGSVWLKSGKTVLLATVVIDENEFAGGEFLPLTVQYIEKAYAAGKFPGGYIKRESKPSDFEALTSRIIDRSLRPLFPKGFTNPIQITVLVLSADEESDLQALALNAASAALYVSDIDIKTSVTSCRIARVEGELIANPTMSQLHESTLDLYVAGSREDLLMIEMKAHGSVETELLSTAMVDPMIDPAMGVDTVDSYHANLVSEEEFIEILSMAQERLNTANKAYESAFDPYAKEPMTMELHEVSGTQQIEAYILEEHAEAVKEAIKEMAKSERSNALRKIRNDVLTKHEEWDKEHVKMALINVKKSMVREQILKEGVRADGRGLNAIRPIDIQTNILPSAHASCLFTRGQTQALVVMTLGGDKDAQMYESLTDTAQKSERFMVHYNFPGFAVREASPIGAPKRRELGHGNLAKRALECTLESPGHTIRLVSEILESNGSSSMATVCGGYMAMRAGEIELTDTIAGIAMGMVSEGSEYAILSDITGLEDHDGDLDFKVAGSKEGISALQMDIKLGGINLEVLKKALFQAKEGRGHIIDVMLEAEKKIETNPDLPTHTIFHIDPARVAEIIGQAGKTIRSIIEKFEVAIDIDRKGGKVKVSGLNREGVKAARRHIEEIANKKREPLPEYQVGDIVEGKVKRIVDFGAFIELPGGVDGLLHISKISDGHIKNITDVISIGDTINVEILEFKGNKISLGRAAV
ncbi:polyribonucleotide nucleotidyltransferase [Sulfurimonas sp. HSL3-7]|uniref:polyribonucleotide nucleotidyltransferase n=1 Tax=Sulfonitrofixus jiaomeiensis TaxID=3131938 RepID=UPI0031F9B118